MLLLVTISQERAALITTSCLNIIECRRMLDVMTKWKVLPIPLQLLEATSGNHEKEDVPHEFSQFTAYCTFFCQPVLLCKGTREDGVLQEWRQR